LAEIVVYDNYRRTLACLMTLRKRVAFAAVVVFTALSTSLTGAVTAHADRTITLTFVRSAQSLSNVSRLVDTSVPGPGLSALGRAQAATAASQMSTMGYDGIYASTMVRSQETAAPLSEALGQPVKVLPDLRQIEGGQYEGQPQADLHDDNVVAWLHGDRSARNPGSITGDEFNARFDQAVQTIYDSGDLNPVAFSHSVAIMAWVLMNVTNPDISLYDSNPLPNTGRIVVVGSPQGGWTLTNWDGIPR
jgi:broad specificity phosphatase PhoE